MNQNDKKYIMKYLIFLIVPIFSKLLIFSPNELRKEFQERYTNSEIPASLGNFGNPPYGTSLVGRLYYPKSISEQKGCTPLTPIQFSEDSDPDLVSTPILMLDRGDCAFVVKVRHAEDIGVKLVIIANNMDTDPNVIIMSDNGMGGNLQIPAIMISQIDAFLIKKYLDNPLYASHISLSVSFDMNKLPDKINYALWTTPTIQSSRYFLMSFATIGSSLNKIVAEFAPHYILWYCPACEKSQYRVGHQDCVSGGRYCSLDPDGDGSLSGRDVMYEDLRQLCLFNLTTTKNYEKWFEYHSEYYSMCSADLFSPSCSKMVFDKIGVDSHKIDKCIKNSFEGDDQTIADNKLLRLEMKNLKEVNVPFYPSIIINEQI